MMVRDKYSPFTVRDIGHSWDKIDREAGLDEVDVVCLKEYNTFHMLLERDMTPDELYDDIEKEKDCIYAQSTPLTVRP